MAEPLARLRAVLEAASPGPWRPEHPCDGLWVVGPDGDVCRGATPSDEAAIAALGTLWPALLAVAERCDRTCDWPTCSPYEHDPTCPVGGLLAAIDAALPEGADAGE